MNKTMFTPLLFLVTVTACNNAGSEKEKAADAAVINAAVKSRIDATLKSFIDSGKTAAVSTLVFLSFPSVPSLSQAMSRPAAIQ